MEPLLRTHLLTLCEAFGSARGVLATTVGKLAMGDSRFFIRLEASEATFTARTYDRLLAWFAAHWPEGAAWPDGVPRPGEGAPANTEAAA